jgi:hypothetical protein
MAPDLSDAQLQAFLEAGLSQREITRRTGIPRSTLQTRLKRLGLQVTPAAPVSQVPPVAPTAPTTPAPPVPTAPPAVTFVAVPEMQELLSLVKDLHARVEAMEQTRVSPALPAPQAPPVTTAPPAAHVVPVTPAPPAAERKDVQQWTIRLSKALIDHLKAVAYERRLPPSQLVEELVWQALHDR